MPHAPVADHLAGRYDYDTMLVALPCAALRAHTTAWLVLLLAVAGTMAQNPGEEQAEIFVTGGNIVRPLIYPHSDCARIVCGLRILYSGCFCSRHTVPSCHMLLFI